MSEEMTNSNNKRDFGYWRSLADLRNEQTVAEMRHREFPKNASEIEFSSDVDRRRFFTLMGSSFALAGMAGACIRKPQEKIMPYTRRAEDVIPGKANYFATSYRSGDAVLGLIVESHDGRPTKVDGNPSSPSSMGATDRWAQASVLDLYDQDRSRHFLKDGKTVTAAEFGGYIANLSKQMRANRGAGVALLVQNSTSPTYTALLRKLKGSFPAALVYSDEGGLSADSSAAAQMIGLRNSKAVFNYDRADVIASFDSDFLGSEGDVVRSSMQFSKRRRNASSKSEPTNRLYVAEGRFSITGAMADHRIAKKTSIIGTLLTELAKELSRSGANVSGIANVPAAALDEASARWIKALARDLLSHRGASVVTVGHRQPAWVQALGHAVNAALGNIGSTVSFIRSAEFEEVTGGVSECASKIADGAVKTLVLVNANPAYAAPSDLGFAELLKSVETIHLGYHVDETGKLANWHAPLSHALESWGDAQASDGSVGITQPLIEPLFESLSEIEFVAMLERGEARVKGYDLVREFWQAAAPADFEKNWRRWLHDGLTEKKAELATASFNFDALSKEIALQSGVAASQTAAQLELVFPVDYSVYDGRYANNAWLQELPDPISKLTWDNALIMNPKTLTRLGLKSEDVVNVSHDGKTLEIAVYELPGIADDVGVVALGYGRSFGGHISTGAGFNANVLRTSKSPYFMSSVELAKTGRTYQLASTQEHWSMEGRALIRQATIDEYKANPDFVQKDELMALDKQRTMLWTEPNNRSGQQWGMAIDLNVCTGCSACTVACQSENNIPVVGKERVLNGREMHWIRLDRYFTGSVDDPQAVVQPVPCMHCETAPCEGVCPVAATTHSADGLNEMTYNRCIGTRYCSNNCPYKVRRFNFFNYSKENDTKNALFGMQKNPNVTVRFRGVMEKCTYCVQRIREAGIEAKRNGATTVADGRIVTACEQACPTRAIVFGDINDPNSRVSKIKADSRNYAMLGELNTRPRTSYLAKLRNPNPELV